MPIKNNKVVVIGHKNPDTDSVCSAIAYAELKNRIGELEYEPRIAGKLNPETEYVLKRFAIPQPRLCTDVNPKIKDIELREVEGISPATTVRNAWLKMCENDIDTLAVVEKGGKLLGLVTIKDIAVANMDVLDNTVLSRSKTAYENILQTLNGTMLTGDPHACVEKGRILIGAANPELMKSVMRSGDIMIMSNRYESQLSAIEGGAGAVIVCQGTKISDSIIALAESYGTVLISVPYDTYGAAKLISQCVAISQYVKTEKIIKFTVVTPIEDVVNVMKRVRFNYFPVVDQDGAYIGMVSRRNIISAAPRKLIFVDHNEASQAVEGYENAEVLEIIDHHRINSIATNIPAYFRNQPLGSTATIIGIMYRENGIVPHKNIAGILLASVLSDTLFFRSPTCTEYDRKEAEILEKIADVDMAELAQKMFEAGENIGGKTAYELLNQDFKIFMCGDIRFGVSQISFMTKQNLNKAKKMIAGCLGEVLRKQNIGDVYVMLTDIKDGSSYIICDGERAEMIFESDFKDDRSGTIFLKDVVSRKKQLVPMLMNAYQHL